MLCCMQQFKTKDRLSGFISEVSDFGYETAILQEIFSFLSVGFQAASVYQFFLQDLDLQREASQAGVGEAGW